MVFSPQYIPPPPLTQSSPCPLSEKLKEDDYDHIPDDPSVAAAMEVDQVTVVLEGEAGRSSGEVNTTSVKTIRTQDEPQTQDFLSEKKINSISASYSEITSPWNSQLLFRLLFVGLG